MDGNSRQAEKTEGDGQKDAKRGSGLQKAVRHTTNCRFIFFAPRPNSSFRPLCEPLGQGPELSFPIAGGPVGRPDCYKSSQKKAHGDAQHRNAHQDGKDQIHP
jgi:hypothetical protein